MLKNVGHYYKSVTATVGALVVLVTQLTPVGNLLPEPEKGWFTTGVAVLTAVSVFLVKNQDLVEAETGTQGS